MTQTDETITAEDVKARENEATREGREARKGDVPLHANPHSKRTIRHLHWATGWVAEDMLAEEGIDASADVILIPEVAPRAGLLWKGADIEKMTRDELAEALVITTRMLYDSFLSRRRFNHARRVVAEGLFKLL